ncbi:cell adhesion molecule-like protein [Euroglyphus maynei]|uniref:Cell adhesion molecule-like protein n=1 Tax=Euroglyphus maynei TaxID=6958 RepID=A0A1Y3BR02_EURMA|nr:cell adhesion molecule-like protein [Euroglyphus maynei]
MGSPFIKPFSNQTAVLGRPYTINCTYGGYPLEEVYFVKGKIGGNNNNDNGKSSSTGSVSSNSNSGSKRMPFDERHLVPMLGSITITIVEKSDQDYYRCVVVTSSGQKAEQEFYLHVAGKFYTCVHIAKTEIVKKFIFDFHCQLNPC